MAYRLLLPSAGGGSPDWVVHPEGDELVGYCLEDDGKTFKPLSELEFRVHSVGGAPKYYWRVRVPSADSSSSTKAGVRLLSSALPTLAAGVSGSPAPHPSIIPKRASKSGLDLLVGVSPVPSLLSWSDLPHLWSVRAAGNSFTSMVMEEARSDARPSSLDW